jgi:hypothetical protein
VDELFNERTNNNENNNKNEQTQESLPKANLTKGETSFFVHIDFILNNQVGVIASW